MDGEEKEELKQILQKLSEIKDEVAVISQKSENSYKWLGKLARRILPISIAVTVIEVLILVAVSSIIYFLVKFFVFSEAGRSIIKFISGFSK